MGIHQMLLSGGDGVVLINDFSISDTTAVASSATYTITSTGAANQSKSTGGTTELEKWIIPQSGMANYTVRAHQTGGGTIDPSSSALDVDLACTSDRAWVVLKIGTGTNTATILVTMKTSGGTTIDTATISLSATVP